MSVTDEVNALRKQYPDALVCGACARLIATRGHGGRPYACAACTTGAPAVERATSRRFEALKARPPLSDLVLSTGGRASRLSGWPRCS